MHLKLRLRFHVSDYSQTTKLGCSFLMDQSSLKMSDNKLDKKEDRKKSTFHEVIALETMKNNCNKNIEVKRKCHHHKQKCIKQ